MPELRDVTVHVTNLAREPFEEWGVQRLKSQTNKVSSYIRSETNMSFKIVIRPTIPYVAHDRAVAHDHETRSRGKERPALSTEESGWENASEWQDPWQGRLTPGYFAGDLYRPSRKHSRSSSGFGNSDRHTKNKSEDHKAVSSPVDRGVKRNTPPDFHLLASLYLDGREKAERRVIVYLDPDDDDFNYPDGTVQIKTRWVQGKDGTLQERGWVFKDVGIETLLDKMLIAGDHNTSATLREDEEQVIVDAMDSTRLDPDEEIQKEEAIKAGQIVVTLERVKLGEKWRDPNFRAKHRDGDVQDTEMDGAFRGVTHTTGLLLAKAVRPEPIRVVGYTPYKRGEPPYAIFTFFYRSQEKLERFNFPGFPKSTKPKDPNRLRVNASLATKTPLGISNAVLSKPESTKGQKDSYEESVKRGDFIKASTPKYIFDHSYRDNLACIKTKPAKAPSLHNISPPCHETTRSTDSPDIKAQTTGTSVAYNLRKRLLALSTPSQNSPPLDTSPPKVSGTFTKSRLLLQKHESTSDSTSPTKRMRQTPVSNSTKFRYAAPESDADDEGSDLETHPGSDTDPEIANGDLSSNHDQDVEGLHTGIGKIDLRKRTRSQEDVGVNDYRDSDATLSLRSDGKRPARRSKLLARSPPKLTESIWAGAGASTEGSEYMFEEISNRQAVKKVRTGKTEDGRARDGVRQLSTGEEDGSGNIQA